MVESCENRMLIFAFYEKCLPISSTKDSTTAQGVKINWFEKFEMLRLLSLTKSILLCAELTRTMVFNLPKTYNCKNCVFVLKYRCFAQYANDWFQNWHF